MSIRKSLQKWAIDQQASRKLNALENGSIFDLAINSGDVKRIARSHKI